MEWSVTVRRLSLWNILEEIKESETAAMFKMRTVVCARVCVRIKDD